MSATVEEWKWNPLIDSELEEWLLCNDEPQIVETNNLPSTLLDSENLNAVYQDLEEQSRNESNCKCAEDFCLRNKFNADPNYWKMILFFFN